MFVNQMTLMFFRKALYLYPFSRINSLKN